MTEPYQPPQPPPPGPAYGPPGGGGQSNGLAVAAMVLGIVGLVLFWVWFLGIPCGIVGLILGFVGLSRANQMGGTGRGMAITGIVTGALAVLAAILFIVIVVASVNEAVESDFNLEDFSLGVRAMLGI